MGGPGRLICISDVAQVSCGVIGSIVLRDREIEPVLEDVIIEFEKDHRIDELLGTPFDAGISDGDEE